MECNKDEAVRSKEIAMTKLIEKNVVLAKKFALKAQNLFPELEGLPQLLATLDVYISAETKINGEIDWYGVLSVDPLADDDTIRKNYRKLALMLHPDKNKLPGADGAFKILSEAWSLLSDKARRSEIDQKRNIRGPNLKVPVRNMSMPAGKNNYHSFPNGININVPNQRSVNSGKPAPPPVSHPLKSNTFWTVCNRCKMQYEYLISYLNHTLLCPNCHEPFLAVQASPPPLNGRKVSTPWDSYLKQKNSNPPVTNMKSDPPRSNHTTPPCAGQSGFSGTNPRSHLPSKPGSHLPPNPSSLPSKSARISQPTLESLKRAHGETHASGSFFVPEGVKKLRTDEITSQAAGRVTGNQIPMKSAVDVRNVSEMSHMEIRKLLVEKARTEIRKKLDEFNAATAHDRSQKNEKPKKQEKQNTVIGGAKDSANPHENNNGVISNKTQEKIESGHGVESDSKDSEVVAMNVPDPDFHDFDEDRTGKSFGQDQVWAAYDDDDGMPRYYAMIHGVVSKRPFNMRISWLNSKSNTELARINWVGSGFPKTCGEFRIGRHVLYNTLNSFSHKVKFVKSKGIINIYPCDGEVWALYRNWSPDWNELTSDEVIHKYDMVEVLEGYSEDGDGNVTVIPLVKVAGFRTVFHRHLDASLVKRIPRKELFRFSHQVPSHLLTGDEALNAPKGCRELDPAATPLELLQVVSEAKGEVVSEKDATVRKTETRLP